MRLRFTIRDLLWLTVVAALAVGWWLEHRQQTQRYATLEQSASVVELRKIHAHYDMLFKKMEAQIEISKMETERAKAFLPSVVH